MSAGSDEKKVDVRADGPPTVSVWRVGKKEGASASRRAGGGATFGFVASCPSLRAPVRPANV